MRYGLHPLTRAFAEQKLSLDFNFEVSARVRWSEFYLQLSARVGWSWNNLHILDLLDEEHIAIREVVIWAFEQGKYFQALQLAKGIEYYNYVRGFWNQKPALHLIQAQSAQRLGEIAEEAEALSRYLQILYKQGEFSEVSKYAEHIIIITRNAELPPEVLSEVLDAQALSQFAQNNIDAAQSIWKRILKDHGRISRTSIASRRWIAVCLYRKGKLLSAKRLFQHALHDAIKENYTRAAIAIQLELSKIEIDLCRFNEAEHMLSSCQELAMSFREMRYIAESYTVYAKLYFLSGNIQSSHNAYEQAISLFERLGMRRELAEARADLARLEAPDAPPVGASGA